MADSNKALKLWEPAAQTVKESAVTSLKTAIEKQISRKFSDFHEFRGWSAENPEIFWAELVSAAGIKFSRSPDKIISEGHDMQRARFFTGAELNYAENVMRHSGSRPALIFRNELGDRREISFDQLRAGVAALQTIFEAEGVQKGDVIAACLPNIPEAIIAMLAAASLGAVWSSVSPEFSAAAAIDRFAQISPKILLVADGYSYKGKKISSFETARILGSELKTLSSLMVIPYLEEAPFIDGLPKAQLLRIPLSGVGRPAFRQVAARHPLCILFSSGTTGKPKCIVHNTAGILTQHVKEHLLEVGVTSADRVFYNTTCGWMMWNWLLSILYHGAAIVIYEGFALAEDGAILFRITEEERITVFGTSAAYLQRAEELKLKPKEHFDLSSLRSVLSTGSRLKPGSFDYVYREIGNVHLSPIWGGTDLCGCLGLSSPVLPVYRGEIQTPALGVAVDVVNDFGQSVIGEEGEVVVSKPFPSMPENLAPYFDKFPGMWRHGDRAIITENGGVVVLGRSDDTLNPGGVRIGAAEITSVAEQFPEVREAMAVSLKAEDSERIVLFLLLKEGSVLSDDLVKGIRESMPSPRHRPAEIIAAPDFPVTLSGKRSIKAVRDAINGAAVTNLEALANPGSLQFFKSCLGKASKNHS